MALQFSQNSLRILSTLRKQVSSGFQLQSPLGLKPEDFDAAMKPLMQAGFVLSSGVPFTRERPGRVLYHVPPSLARAVDRVLQEQPVRLSTLPLPANDSLQQDSQIALAALRCQGISSGSQLMRALQTSSTTRLADALDPLVQQRIITYAGLPFTEQGLKDARFAPLPSASARAERLLSTRKPGGMVP